MSRLEQENAWAKKQSFEDFEIMVSSETSALTLLSNNKGSTLLKMRWKLPSRQSIQASSINFSFTSLQSTSFMKNEHHYSEKSWKITFGKFSRVFTHGEKMRKSFYPMAKVLIRNFKKFWTHGKLGLAKTLFTEEKFLMPQTSNASRQYQPTLTWQGTKDS